MEKSSCKTRIIKCNAALTGCASTTTMCASGGADGLQTQKKKQTRIPPEEMIMCPVSSTESSGAPGTPKTQELSDALYRLLVKSLKEMTKEDSTRITAGATESLSIDSDTGRPTITPQIGEALSETSQAKDTAVTTEQCKTSTEKEGMLLGTLKALISATARAIITAIALAVGIDLELI